MYITDDADVSQTAWLGPIINAANPECASRLMVTASDQAREAIELWQ